MFLLTGASHCKYLHSPNKVAHAGQPLGLLQHPYVHTDGIALQGTAIGDDNFLETFLQQKIDLVSSLLSKVNKLQLLHSKYQLLKLSINAKLR